MSGVEYLLGSENLPAGPLKVYDEGVLAWAAEFSETLRKDREARAWPDLQTLAFQFRPAWLKSLPQAPEAAEGRRGRGLAFHIAPANVPVNFAFSLLFSALAGNANLVRVPSRPFPQTEIIVRVLKDVLGRHPQGAARTSLAAYAADEDITAAFSARADLRIIWGGDETVARLKAMKTKPRCLDICFPDRYSLALLDGPAVARAGERELAALARGFYNDVYLMDQRACSAPHIVLWQNASEPAREKFWAAVEAEVVARGYALPAAAAVDKLERACLDAAEFSGRLDRLIRHGNLIYRARLKSPPENAPARGFHGYFHEYDLKDRAELRGLIDESCQTATYYGLDPEELRDFIIQEGLPGLDRLVPVGSALNMGLVWDGFDLIRTFSRRLALD